MKVGLIYAYRDPVSYNWIYVGSIQKQNTIEKRHLAHLKDNHLFSTWLQFMYSGNVRVKPEIMQYVGYEHVRELYKKEDEWMKNLGTMWPKGLNRAKAEGPDHAVMGHFGAKRHNELYGCQISSEARSRGGRLGALNQPHEVKVCNGQNMAHKQSHEDKILGGRLGGHALQEKVLAGEISRSWLSRAGKIGSSIANHNRWHKRRDKISQECSLCLMTK